MKNPASWKSRLSISPACLLLLGLASVTVSGCMSRVYEKERFPSDHVRVVHSGQHCRDVDWSAATQFPNADLVNTTDIGIGRSVATRTAWEIIARQLAAELDADMALVKPCDGEYSFEYAQIEVWRTRGFNPSVQAGYLPQSGALLAPSHTSFGARLENILQCLEQAEPETSGPISSASRKRLGNVDPTRFFSGKYQFPGYANVDRFFQPAQTGDLRLSMIYSDRERAARAAVYYRELPVDEKRYFAERYLLCLLDRGYSLWSGNSSDSVLRPTPEGGQAEL